MRFKHVTIALKSVLLVRIKISYLQKVRDLLNQLALPTYFTIY